MTDETISIPDARAQLCKWAVAWDKPELMELAQKMVRRKPKYPAARANRGSLDPILAENIRAFKAKNPERSNRDIGAMFGVDGGRVSEAIHKTKGI